MPLTILLIFLYIYKQKIVGYQAVIHNITNYNAAYTADRMLIIEINN